jgi:hypothetical protein
VPRRQQHVDVLLVDVEPLRLAIGRVGAAHVGPFVPRDAQPPQRIEDGGLRLQRGARAVGVFDADDELAAALAREREVEQRDVRRAHVRVARGGRRDAQLDRTIAVPISEHEGALEGHALDDKPVLARRDEGAQ